MPTTKQGIMPMTCCNGYCPNEPVEIYQMLVVKGVPGQIPICQKHIEIFKDWAGTILGGK